MSGLFLSDREPSGLSRCLNWRRKSGLCSGAKYFASKRSSTAPATTFLSADSCVSRGFVFLLLLRLLGGGLSSSSSVSVSLLIVKSSVLLFRCDMSSSRRRFLFSYEWALFIAEKLVEEMPDKEEKLRDKEEELSDKEEELRGKEEERGVANPC